MGLRLLADVLVGIHFLFVLFVVGGGFLAWRWPRVVWAHVPVALVTGRMPVPSAAPTQTFSTPSSGAR